MSFASRLPPPVHPGERVRVIAPSSGFARLRFERGLAMLRDRYDVQLGDAVWQRDGYMAGTDEERLADLVGALEDDSVRAIIGARGGYGATRIADAITPERVAANAKWLVGFSDLTALHALWRRAGVASLHGAMVCSLPEASGEVQCAWFDALAGEPHTALTGKGLTQGSARGPLVGGNLAVLTALVGTRQMPPLSGCVLLLEDVGERPYRIDRMLTTLRQAGAFEGIAGVALGQFSDCEPGDDGRTTAETLAAAFAPLDVPVVADLLLGHIPNNHSVVLGAEAIVDAGSGTLTTALTGPTATTP